MNKSRHIFHLAIPCANLSEAKEFYVNQLGCELAREYEDRITLNFFGDQVVCHLAPNKIDTIPEMYPRHFGTTFKEKQDYDALLTKAKQKNIKFYRDNFVRFAGTQEEHHTFFLQDPSNNLLEFKYYFDPKMIY